VTLFAVDFQLSTMSRVPGRRNREEALHNLEVVFDYVIAVALNLHELRLPVNSACCLCNAGRKSG
jgi:hypothetical protein